MKTAHKQILALLLFANLDGVAYEADTQVFITDNNGNTCEW